ncbi:hypothetical protein PMIN02_010556 [Paraphaeosphaeria minitans]
MNVSRSIIVELFSCLPCLLVPRPLVPLSQTELSSITAKQRPQGTPLTTLLETFRMSTSSSNSGTNRSDPGRVGNNTQTNGNGETATRDEQRSTSTNGADSTPRTVYINDLQDDLAEAGTRNLDYLRFFYDEPQTNGNESKP